MALQNWVLPILIGIVSAVVLLAILCNDPYIKSKFSDLGALIQLETSRPVYYGINWIPLNNSTQLPLVPPTNNITSFNSPNYIDGINSQPIYNYFPKTPLTSLTPTQHFTKPNTKPNTIPNTTQSQNNSAYANPNKAYNSHKAFYWGGYPYPYPVIYLPPTDMDNVKGIEDKI